MNYFRQYRNTSLQVPTATPRNEHLTCSELRKSSPGKDQQLALLAIESPSERQGLKTGAFPWPDGVR